MPHVPYYYIGLDLGQRADFSAFATVEYTPGGLPHFLSPWTIPPDVYRLRQLHRVPLGSPYGAVVDKVARFVALPELKGRSTLVVDTTGLGVPVVEMIRDREMDCLLLPVVITGAERGGYNRGYRTVPKHDLISNLEIHIAKVRVRNRLPYERFCSLVLGGVNPGARRNNATGGSSCHGNGVHPKHPCASASIRGPIMSLRPKAFRAAGNSSVWPRKLTVQSSVAAPRHRPRPPGLLPPSQLQPRGTNRSATGALNASTRSSASDGLP